MNLVKTDFIYTVEVRKNYKLVASTIFNAPKPLSPWVILALVIKRQSLGVFDTLESLSQSGVKVSVRLPSEVRCIEIEGTLALKN